ncbi:MAG: class I SAM-dependent methyltransferase, partial [Actinomycetota bacterium]|nr:class I SAM-dependent methyltransferase [Actinomycetota bacterium]
SQLEVYFNSCFALLAPGGRFLNHAVARVPAFGRGASLGRFCDRYVFPDAEVHEVGVVVSAVQRAGFEALHMEVFGEHYARTLRSWVANLEASWGAAIGEIGERRARIWRLYMAAVALAFEGGRVQVAQVLAARRRRDG